MAVKMLWKTIMLKRNYYETLGLTKGANADEIKKAYRSKAKELHPDRNRDNPRSEAQFKDLGEAYAVLKDTNKRAVYDGSGHEKEQNEQNEQNEQERREQKRRDKEQFEKQRRKQEKLKKQLREKELRKKQWLNKEQFEKKRREKQLRENKSKRDVGDKPRNLGWICTATLLLFLLPIGVFNNIDEIIVVWLRIEGQDAQIVTDSAWVPEETAAGAQNATGWINDPIISLAVSTPQITILDEGDIPDHAKAKIMHQIRQCWTLSNVSPAVMRTSVVVGFSLNAGGILDTESFEMKSFTNGTTAEAEVVYRAARSALVRCPQGRRGKYDVPVEQFKTRRVLELIVDPSQMAL
jgi:hypothetical protein